MGSPTLKKKVDLNYRKGPAAHDCSQCDHFVPAYAGRAWPVCMIMGLGDGRAYRINPRNICDAYDSSRYMERLMGRKRVAE